ncbi:MULTISPECIES: hypothetical protein [Burkholderia]|uniref:Uncharacterized protein n=1 Tax=Burkholderia contaminans TaxID=488447 RepID=A0A2S5DRK2_9BURK|nr:MULTISPECIES: hypothetical protein [Burkholderia]EKS9794844.1 hypothetical protein [Burkholderia cepacia]EKS9802799.1 hypothetical protein [Burkholderia cepacia]EKS9809306.1 hypothetical protein [Burkholderia cepacia]EKS9818167.1 hypothetical protein [Burkholderia cepacia]EKS9824161.1 hypothetical protein [Burkholderia cepacia]
MSDLLTPDTSASPIAPDAGNAVAADAAAPSTLASSPTAADAVSTGGATDSLPSTPAAPETIPAAGPGEPVDAAQFVRPVDTPDMAAEAVALGEDAAPPADGAAASDTASSASPASPDSDTAAAQSDAPPADEAPHSTLDLLEQLPAEVVGVVHAILSHVETELVDVSISLGLVKLAGLKEALAAKL